MPRFTTFASWDYVLNLKHEHQFDERVSLPCGPCEQERMNERRGGAFGKGREAEQFEEVRRRLSNQTFKQEPLLTCERYQQH